jgi:hypothetical protein
MRATPSGSTCPPRIPRRPASPMRAFVTLVMAVCLPLGMADAWARASAAEGACGRSCPHARHEGGAGARGIPVCPGPATCPLVLRGRGGDLACAGIPAGASGVVRAAERPGLARREIELPAAPSAAAEPAGRIANLTIHITNKIEPMKKLKLVVAGMVLLVAAAVGYSATKTPAPNARACACPAGCTACGTCDGACCH